MIPHHIHFIWWDGDLPDHQRENIERWRQYNPTWKLRLWNRLEIESFIRAEYPTPIVKAFRKIPLTKAKDKFRHIRHVDCARLLILHRLGGVYLDTDLIPQRPLTTFLSERQQFLQTFTRFDPKKPITLPEILSSQEAICPGGFPYIVFRDTRKMDGPKDTGVAIINGALFSRAHDQHTASWLLDFTQTQLRWSNRRKPVLDAFGTYAIARYLRNRRQTFIDQDKPANPDNILYASGHYVVWDEYVFGPRPWFILSTHDGSTGAQSWGNDNLAQPWKSTK